MRKLKLNQEYRHFKGGVYKTYVISRPINEEDMRLFRCSEATHTETKERFNLLCIAKEGRHEYYHDSTVDTGELIIYYKDKNKLWARPIDDFLSKIDREGVNQEYRFEEV